jgi:hypothetical protein
MGAGMEGSIVFVLISGQLWRDPATRQSKAGKQMRNGALEGWHERSHPKFIGAGACANWIIQRNRPIFARQAKNIEAEAQACEIRLRAERKCGQLLKEREMAKGANPTNRMLRAVASRPRRPRYKSDAIISLAEARRRTRRRVRVQQSQVDFLSFGIARGQTLYRGWRFESS